LLRIFPVARSDCRHCQQALNGTLPDFVKPDRID
jgi:hypothetical protein